MQRPPQWPAAAHCMTEHCDNIYAQAGLTIRACEQSGKRSGAGGKWGERERSGERAKSAAQSPLTPTLR